MMRWRINCQVIWLARSGQMADRSITTWGKTIDHSLLKNVIIRDKLLMIGRWMTKWWWTNFYFKGRNSPVMRVFWTRITLPIQHHYENLYRRKIWKIKCNCVKKLIVRKVNRIERTTSLLWEVFRLLKRILTNYFQ
jgi:hypothetical protein